MTSVTTETAKASRPATVALARGAHTTLRRTLTVCLLLTLALLSAGLISMLMGSQRLPVGGSLCLIFGGNGGRCGLKPEQQSILLDLRLPRVLLAASVGASLAAAGAGYQALLRNPLAEPYLLRISNGAGGGSDRTDGCRACCLRGAWAHPLRRRALAIGLCFVIRWPSLTCSASLTAQPSA